ncbi:O-antigen ligase family protein [Actinotalea caeni]|uniref:O-antigen ligase family protein n=1 Tax=Actinotalea caeni TaxID=1348467 RepID=UPI0012E1DE0C|nr:O-antigen ligase family protein [Actinotalea caeni]
MSPPRALVDPSPLAGARSVLSTGAGVAVLVGLGLMAGLTAAIEPGLALPLAVVVLLVAVAAIDLSLLPVLAVPASMMVARLGPMSIADFALGGATVIALLMLRNKGAVAMQPLMWAGSCYIALSAPQLLLNPYAANAVEWVHELVLVLGSLVVGFVVGREGHARLALGLYVAICWVLALLAIGTAFANGFGPVYIGGLHKNALGAILMVGAIVGFANPTWLRWTPLFGYLTFGACALGAFAAQSRQALVGALVGALVVGLRPRFHNGKRSRLIWLVTIPGMYFVYSAVLEQLESDNPFNSANQRLDWYADSVKVWEMSPLFGVGHRWWVTGHTGYSGFQPPNVVLEVLTTVGVLGLIGFLAMFGAAIWILATMNPVYGTLALALVAGRFAQAQFDIYWVAGHASILWIVAGICYGVQARDEALGIRRIPHPVQTVFRRTRGVRA